MTAAEGPADRPSGTASPGAADLDEPAGRDGSGPPSGEVGPAPTYGASFWVGLAVGWAVMGYGVWGVLDESDLTRPPDLALWVVGAAIAHDALLAPVVAVVGVALAAVLPRWVRGPVRAALAVSGVVVLFAYPALRGFGRRQGNPSILPLDYQRNVLLVLAVVWVVAAVAAAVRRRAGTDR